MTGLHAPELLYHVHRHTHAMMQDAVDLGLTPATGLCALIGDAAGQLATIDHDAARAYLAGLARLIHTGEQSDEMQAAAALLDLNMVAMFRAAEDTL